jgi:SLT domain-containing protein
VPAFAEGGVVDRPTLAMVGEGGEREFIIPESKMAATSANYLAATAGTGAANTRPAPINITTGPVLQAENQQWVTVQDLMQAMRATEAATLNRLRTPAGRRAVGVR